MSTLLPVRRSTLLRRLTRTSFWRGEHWLPFSIGTLFLPNRQDARGTPKNGAKTISDRPTDDSEIEEVTPQCHPLFSSAPSPRLRPFHTPHTPPFPILNISVKNCGSLEGGHSSASLALEKASAETWNHDMFFSLGASVRVQAVRSLFMFPL